MDNKKVAIELLKVAKSLVSVDVADTEGWYRNFTGKIRWRNSKGTVKNATFALKEGNIFWEKGTWLGGEWGYGIWKMVLGRMVLG